MPHRTMIDIASMTTIWPRDRRREAVAAFEAPVRAVVDAAGGRSVVVEEAVTGMVSARVEGHDRLVGHDQMAGRERRHEVAEWRHEVVL